MAAWIPKITQVTRTQNVCTVSFAVQSSNYCTQPRVIKSTSTAALKRGTGGRSSFNGIVCTVFGCSGFIGGRLCIRLGSIGTQLILPHRCDPYHIRELKVGGDLGQVLYHPFDLRDEESIIRSIKYSNVVINLIGSDHETSNFSYNDVHVKGARTLARLAKQCNIERFIHVSCLNASEHPEPLMLKHGSRILQSKWEGEQAVKEEFPEATIIRPSIIYGRGDKFLTHYLNSMRQVFKAHLPLWKRGEHTEKQPVFIGDVITGIIAAMKNPDSAGKTYQFVGPKRYKLRKLVEWMYELVLKNGQTKKIFVTNLKYEPFLWIKAFLVDYLRIIHPISDMTWEVLEHHHTSDIIDPELPTLEDLGITAVNMEENIKWAILPLEEFKYIATSLQQTRPLEVHPFRK